MAMAGASFVKCLADPNFSSELQVPKEFLKKYGGTLHPTIELMLESEPRISWNVNTELVGNRCFLTEGWGGFAEEAGLKHLETVVFTFNGDSAFDVSVYDVNGCKKLPSDAAAEIISVVEISDDEEEEIAGPTVPEYWTFSKTVGSTISFKFIRASDNRVEARITPRSSS